MVANTVIDDPGLVPIGFVLSFDPDAIDPAATYMVAAEIVDGERKWVTQDGTPVLTQGNPTSVDLVLAYLPDVSKGAVTGTITGPAVTLSDSAYSATILIDRTAGTRVGIDVNDAPGQVPIAFSVPFDPANIDQASNYTVSAAIVDGASRWANPDGVAVITQGQPLSDVVVPVAAVTSAVIPQTSSVLLGFLGLWILVALAVVWWAWYRLRRPLGLQTPAMPARPPTPIEPTPSAIRDDATVIPAEPSTPVEPEATATPDEATAISAEPPMSAEPSPPVSLDEPIVPAEPPTPVEPAPPETPDDATASPPPSAPNEEEPPS
jgi:uncharacterized lipoprotein YbaY